MKIVVISDTHGQAIDIPPCDLLLHCGDISPMTSHAVPFQQEWFYMGFLPELRKLPAKNIVFIGGNHDFFLEQLAKTDMERRLRKALPPHITYLRDNSVTVEGLTIHGTPWIPELIRWAFYLPDDDAPAKYQKIPMGLDILLSHGPPHGCCDTILQWDYSEHLGSRPLRDNVMVTAPKYLFCGHIHSGAHEFESLGSTKVRNCSVLDEDYKKAYAPLILDY